VAYVALPHRAPTISKIPSKIAASGGILIVYHLKHSSLSLKRSNHLLIQKQFIISFRFSPVILRAVAGSVAPFPL
jgi:hypothetical protein